MNMTVSLKRPLIVLALMLGVAAASVLAVPNNKLADTRIGFNLETAIPKQFGDWRLDTSIVPLPPSPDQQSVLNEIYDQVLSRTYVNSKGERVMLSITYGSRQNQQLRAHRQEVCYSAQGFKISGLERVELPLDRGAVITATRMVATQRSRVEPVTYWFTTGDHVVASYWDRELAQFRFAMSGYVPDGYLFRVSTLDSDSAVAFERQLVFTNALLSSIDPELRRRLTGHV